MNIQKLKKAYIQSKSAKVGDQCTCPSCSTVFIKTNYQQAFCRKYKGTICKDYYWNNVTPNKRNNTTRISPASAAWMEQQQQDKDYRDIYNDFHPFEGLNDEDYKNF